MVVASRVLTTSSRPFLTSVVAFCPVSLSSPALFVTSSQSPRAATGSRATAVTNTLMMSLRIMREKISKARAVASELLAQEVGDLLGHFGGPLDGRGVRAARHHVQLRVDDEL